MGVFCAKSPNLYKVPHKPHRFCLGQHQTNQSVSMQFSAGLSCALQAVRAQSPGACVSASRRQEPPRVLVLALRRWEPPPVGSVAAAARFPTARAAGRRWRRCTTLAGRQLLSPTCQTAVAALFNGAGEREVKKLNLLRSPVFWCLGDGPTMHEPGALPKTPGRRVTALPMTDHLVTRPGADAQPQRPRSQVLVLACRRVCWALSGRHRAGGRTRRCVLKITRWELTTWVVFVAVSAVWRLEARRASRFGLSYTCQGVGCR